MEKEREQSILYGMGKELVVCPICEGKKTVKKVSAKGTICYYSDRVTAIRVPCGRCNGNGIITKGGKK